MLSRYADSRLYRHLTYLEKTGEVRKKGQEDQMGFSIGQKRSLPGSAVLGLPEFPDGTMTIAFYSI